MISKQSRRRIVIGCVVTMILLSAGVILARSRVRTEVDPGSVKPVEGIVFRPVTEASAEAALTFGVSLDLPSDRGTVTSVTGRTALAPTFERFRSGVAIPTDPGLGEPSIEPATKPPIAPPKTQVPGPVTNLRRTDRR